MPEADPRAEARKTYLAEMDKVEGWLVPTAAHVIDHLLAAQIGFGVHGNVMEIGVYRGKLFVLLALGMWEVVYHDMCTAEQMVGPGGIVAADDIYETDWSGVTAGIARYYCRGGNLVPFAIGTGKLFVTTSEEWAATYKESLGTYLRMEERPLQQVFEFDDVMELRSLKHFHSEEWVQIESGYFPDFRAEPLW